MELDARYGERGKGMCSPLAAVTIALLATAGIHGAAANSSSNFVEEECPTGCFCALSEVDCSNRGLTQVPKNLPRGTKQL